MNSSPYKHLKNKIFHQENVTRLYKAVKPFTKLEACGLRVIGILPGTFNMESSLFEGFSIWKFASSATRIRQFLVISGNPFLQHVIQQNYLMFLKCADLHLTRNAYSLLTGHGVWQSLKVVMDMISIRESSTDLLLTYLDGKSNEMLGYSRCKYVFINGITRKRTSINWDSVHGFAGLPLPKKTSFYYDMPAMPTEDKIFRCTSVICYSDIDSNSHCGNAIYIRLCFDCVHSATINKHPLRDFDLSQQLQSYICNYIKECVVNDVVTVCMWQDDADRNRIHFRHYVEETFCFGCTFRYYSKLLSQL